MVHLLKFLVILAILAAATARAAPLALSYGGRLSEADGRPVVGPVDLEVRFFRSAAGADPVPVPVITVTGVVLAEGGFTIQLPLDESAWHQVFPDAATPTFLELRDVTHGRTYPRQSFSAVPFALKVPVDGKTLTYDVDGKLGVGPATAPVANQFLTKDGTGALVWGSPSTTGLGAVALAPQSTLGLGTFTNAQETPLTTGLGAADKGKTWFNADIGQVRYWNGSVAQSLGTAGSGLQSLGGLTANDQILAVDTTGTALDITHAVATHTLHIPLAATAGVAAGLISKAQYDALNGKQAALGFTPVNKAGDTMAGPLSMGTSLFTVGGVAADPGGLGAPDAGKLWLNTTAGVLKTYDGSAVRTVSTIDGVGHLALNAVPTASTTIANLALTNGVFAGGHANGQFLGINTPAGNTANMVTLANNGVTAIEVRPSGSLVVGPNAAGGSQSNLSVDLQSGTVAFMENKSLSAPLQRVGILPSSISNSSGTMTLLSIAMPDSTSATGGYTGILVNKTGAGAGSGAKRLLDLQVGSVSQVVVDATGKVGIGGVTVPSQTLAVAGSIGIRETGGTPTYYTSFQGGDQGADIAYTLPPTQGAAGAVLTNGGTGTLTWTQPPVISGLGAAKRLIVKNGAPAASQVLVTADELILRNASNAPLLLFNVNVAAAITASGVDGLDTGSEAANTWYYIWVVSDGTTTSGLLSLSSSAPTMPGAYTYKALVGAVRNDATSNLLTFMQVGRKANYRLMYPVLAAAGTTTTAIALGSFVPPLATEVKVQVGAYTTTAGSAGFCYFGPTSGLTIGTSHSYLRYQLNAGGDMYEGNQDSLEYALETPQTLYYIATNAGGMCQAWVQGFMLE